MTTAIIGTGNIGGTLARHLVPAASPSSSRPGRSECSNMAQELVSSRARLGRGGVAEADAVVFAVWLDTIRN
jgi:predicted dinucleotide-binding enzyme